MWTEDTNTENTVLKTMRDRFFEYEFCVTCLDNRGITMTYDAIPFSGACHNNEINMVYNKFNTTHIDKATQTILIDDKSSTYGYVTPETGVIQDGYFQLYGLFDTNNGPDGSPCLHSWAISGEPDAGKFDLVMVSDTDWRVYLTADWKGTVGPHPFWLLFNQENPPDWTYYLDRPNYQIIKGLTLFQICEPIETFKDYNAPGTGVHTPINTALSPMTYLTMYKFTYMVYQPPVTINEWTYASTRTKFDTACFVLNEVYDLDKASPVSVPGGVVIPLSNQFEFKLAAADNTKHGIYEFYIRSTLTNVPNPPQSIIWTEMVTMRIGCAFHTVNVGYPPFVEDLALEEPLFDSSVWSFLDYSIFTGVTVASTPVPPIDMKTYFEGGHLDESFISCGQVGAAQCTRPKRAFQLLWPYTQFTDSPELLYEHKLVKNNYPSYSYGCTVTYKAVTNTDINNLALSTQVTTSQVTVTTVIDPLIPSYQYDHFLRIDYICDIDKVITFKILVELPQTTIKPSWQMEYQNYIFTKDFSIKCHCHYPEQLSTPQDFVLDHLVYVTQVESTEFKFPTYGWGLCKRSMCPFNSTCAWPSCETPCKPMGNFELMHIDKISQFKDVHPGVITDDSFIHEGRFSVQNTKVGYYDLHALLRSTEDPNLMTDIGTGSLVPIQGTFFSPQISIKVICGPIYLSRNNSGQYKLPTLNRDKEPFKLENRTIIEMFTLKDGRVCYDEEVKYALYKDKECTSKLPIKQPLESNLIYFKDDHIFINRMISTPRTNYYICAYYDHPHTNKNSTLIQVEICGFESLELKEEGKGGSVPIVQGGFIKHSTFTGLGAGIQMIPVEKYYGIYKSSIDYCPVTIRELVWQRNDSYVFEELPKKYAMKDDKDNILVNTAQLVDEENTKRLHSQTYIMFGTKDSPVRYYVRINITIYDIDLERVRRLTNTAPFFLAQPRDNITQYISDDPSSRIIKFFTAYDTFSFQKIFVKTGGEFDKRIMYFDPELMELKFKNLEDEHFKDYKIEIILYDDYFAENKYEIDLSLRKQDPFKWNVTSDFYQRNATRPEDEVHAKMKFITYNGYAYVQFNKEMFTDFNQSAINNTEAMDIYVHPQDGRSDIRFINLTWSLVHYNGSEMKIKLDFEHFEYISPSIVQDRLVIFFNHTEFFISKDKMIPVSDSTRTIKGKIRRQVEDDWFTRMVLNSAGAIDQTVKYALIITFFMATSLSNSMRFLISFINSSQIVIHLPTLRIVVPGNVSVYMSILLDITQFDILDPEWTTELLFNFDYERQEIINDYEFSQIIDMGYETHNIVLCMGSVFIFMICYCGLLLVYGMTYLLRNEYRIMGKLYLYLKRLLIFHLMISLLYDSYIFSLFSTVQNFMYPLDTENGEVLGKYFTFVMLFLLVGLTPAIILYVVTRPMESIRDKSFIEVWGTAYLEVRTNQRHQLFYYPLFIFRRIAFVAAIFLLKDYPAFQLMSVIFYNLFMIEFVGQFWPLKDNFKNKVDIHNETYVSVLTLLFSIFTDAGPEDPIKYQYGWVYIYILFTYCLTNIIAAAFNVYYNLRLIFIKYYNRLRWYYPWLVCKKKKQPSMRYFPKPVKAKAKPFDYKAWKFNQQKIKQLAEEIKEEEKIKNDEVPTTEINIINMPDLNQEMNKKENPINFEDQITPKRSSYESAMKFLDSIKVPDDYKPSKDLLQFEPVMTKKVDVKNNWQNFDAERFKRQFNLIDDQQPPKQRQRPYKIDRSLPKVPPTEGSVRSNIDQMLSGMKKYPQRLDRQHREQQIREEVDRRIKPATQVNLDHKEPVNWETIEEKLKKLGFKDEFK